MSQLAVEGFRAERDSILTVAKGLTAEEWAQPSACAGWSVGDVLGHMGCTLHGLVDPKQPPCTTKGADRGSEPAVLQRRAWPVAAVIEEYETYSGRAIEVFASLQAPAGDKVIPMADFGMQPMSSLASTFLFDGYTHFRGDILGPNGSVGRPEPPRDEARLRPTVEWMLAVLPWMCADALGAVVDRPLALTLDGPGGGSWTIAPGGTDGRVAVVEEPALDVTTTVRSTDHDFAMWGTRRTPWRDHVTIEGDADYAAGVLDAINIV